MTKLIKRVKTSSFIGKQLSRLKMGQSYYSLLTSTISAISLASIAFQINLWLLLLMFPIFLLITYFIGYYLDIRNINTMDTLKSNEMANRFLNTGDMKNQEFQLLLFTTLIEAIKTGDDFDEDVLFEKYLEYKKKWESPEALIFSKKKNA